MNLRAVAVWAGLLALAAVATAWAVPRYGAVFVGGWSMAPTLCRGDLVIYRRAGAAREGDVVFVSKTGWPEGVLHRVIAVSPGGGLVLKGDANMVPDRDAVGGSAVRGVCALVVPTGRAYLGARRVLARWYNLPSPAA